MRAQSQSSPQQVEAPRFAILEFEVEGNTVLSVAQVEQVLLPFLGEDRQMADVEAAREALEKRYQQAGFLSVFVDIPEQRVDAGLLRLRVTEGRVERLRVTGSRYYDQGVIRERVAELAPGRVPDFNEAARQIAELSREERRVQQLLRPGSTPGTVEVELRVNDQLPLAAQFELNNRHAADTEALRASALLRYDNLWQRDHSLSLSLITAPRQTRQSTVLVANYLLPLSGKDSLLASAVLSNSHVEPLGAGTVIGQGKTLGLRWMRTLASPGAKLESLHSFNAGFDFKDVKERQLSSGNGSGSELSTPLRYLPWQLSYAGNWFAGRAQSSLTSGLTFGWRNWLQRDVSCPGNLGAVDQFQCKRDGADGSFAYWRAELRDGRPLADFGLPKSWPGSLNSRLAWQLATQPLVSGEQYALGGADTVRGYLEAEASGDNAVLASLEWRSGNLLGAAEASPAEAGKSPPFWRELALLAYADAGRSQTLQPMPEQTEHVWLGGAGLGLRLRAGRGLSAEFDLAWPLKSTRTSPKYEPRLHFRLSAQL
ncbi:hemolysin activation/secretion protein [Paucibacter oligotrophus]|uniref:Hemolysin activation/secretion protein n=1 Tax=Roseateles oligotrophus TaxID=1769250 RepID=A0A840LIQ4_9BURK|nr:hemolysin activation/secretion protein [Roseateles oligotrophus]